MEQSSDFPKNILNCLDWSLDKLNDALKTVKDMTCRQALKEAENRRRASYDAPLSAKNSFSEAEDSSRRNSRLSQSGSEEGSRAQELPPLFYERKMSSGRENHPPGWYGANSAVPTSTPFQPKSPAQATSKRTFPTLPSPASMTFSSSNVLPPVSPSIVGGETRSPQTAHLQDLQHQLSTKSLAHQILQGEHEKLLSAYSRLQVRCAALDKKSQVSDTEINNLSEDCSRLQCQVDELNQQVEELQKSRDNDHRQSMANESQYMQIMEMSTKLQALSAADQKKWKADREAWGQERENLIRRIADLERSQRRGDGSANPSREGTGFAVNEPSSSHDEANDVTMSNDVDSLREEIVRLRKIKWENEVLVQAYKTKIGNMSRLLDELGGVGEKMKKVLL